MKRNPLRFPRIAIVPVLVASASCADAPYEPTYAPLPVAPTAAAPLPATFIGPQPVFGPTLSSATPPPPLSGGTLAVSRDGRIAVAADPDFDRLYVIDLHTRSLRHTVALPSGAEPGRVAFDASGRAWVALRRAGQVAVLDPGSAAFTLRTACRAPRGVAAEANADRVYVACADGDLVTFSGGTSTRRYVASDLRDVVLTPSGIAVSRFRSAELLRVADDRTEAASEFTGTHVAWRVAVPAPASSCASCNDAVMVSQEPAPEVTISNTGQYYSPVTIDPNCSAASIVTTRLRVANRGSVTLPRAVLPVDVATNGREHAVVAAGNAFTSSLPQVFVVQAETVARANGGCAAAVEGKVDGQVTSAAYAGGDLLVLTREPAALHVMAPDRRAALRTIRLSDESRRDTGHEIFHANAGAFVACASCHAEGGDDGRVWRLPGGDRRTPSLRGTFADTAPYHWNGELANADALIRTIFSSRMSGPAVDAAQVRAMSTWLGTIPELPRARMPDAMSARGAPIFDRQCASCHGGPRFTNNRTVDVGTGGKFQVPSLVGVAWRAPFLHSGCATSLKERFGPCGGDAHGQAGLSGGEIDDLVSFLETL